MNAYALSTGSLNDQDGHSANSDLLNTTALAAILPIQEIPTFLLCPGCGMVYEVAYCLSCSHNVCQWCYEREIAQNRYIRCFVCHALVVSRPYLNSALNQVACGYHRHQRSGIEGCDVRQQYPIQEISGKTQGSPNQWAKYLGDALCGPFFCGESVLICDRRSLSIGSSAEIERKTLCLTRFTSSLEVVLVPQHRTQTTFMGLMFVHKGCSAHCTAQLSPLSVKFSITVVNQVPEKSRTYECIHTFSRGGGCYNIPIGPRSVLFDPQRNYATPAGTVSIQVSASVFTTLSYEDALAISGAAQRLLVNVKRCASMDLEALIDRGIAHDKPEVAAHITRFILTLATIQYSVVLSPNEASIQGYKQDATTVALCFWLKESLLFTRLLKRAVRHIDSDDYELIGATLGRHCLVFLENGGPADAFDVTLKDGMLKKEDLDIICDQNEELTRLNARTTSLEREVKMLEAKLTKAEKELDVQKEQARLAEHHNTKLDSIIKKEINKSLRLKKALLELVGSSDEILDRVLYEHDGQTTSGRRRPSVPTFILPAGLHINGVLSRAPKEMSLLHKGYIELTAINADLPPVLKRLLRRTVLMDIKAIGVSPAALALLLKLLSARPTLRIRYTGSDSVNEFVELLGLLPPSTRDQRPVADRRACTQEQLAPHYSTALKAPCKPPCKDSEYQLPQRQPNTIPAALAKPPSARSRRH